MVGKETYLSQTTKEGVASGGEKLFSNLKNKKHKLFKKVHKASVILPGTR